MTFDPPHCLNLNSSALYYYLFKAMLLVANDPFIERLMYPYPMNHVHDRQQVTQQTVNKLRKFLYQPILLTPITIHLSDFDSLRMMSI